ncbi:hypothetical protein [Paracidobacterium acidisoli]|uniref:hypothetical protein n=1 Tax=Paracidobacterium acidisoli TaxID=2303751 RepID=UPI0011C0CF52|nr:hypothetical protein [Paracidobacterium acidisoli]MBT9330113.1 hypothetical protein [Paracidobacterium acidisoli]
MAASSPASQFPASVNGALLSGDARWQLAQRVAASDIFSRSEFLPKFLLDICELYLLGRTEEIREQQIGVRVFGRSPGYNPGDDNIVRNYAVQLRKRLNLYFEKEGKDEPFRIEIPRGGYIPVFHARKTKEEPSPVVTVISAAKEPETAAESHPDLPIPAAPRRADWRMFLAGLAIGLLLLGAAAFRWKLQTAPATVHAAPANPLWSAIFVRDRDTFIVPADSSLGILQNLTEEPVSLTSYLSGEYLSSVKVKGMDLGNLNDLRIQRYTSMVDLNITSRLSHLPEVVPDHLIVRYARDLRMDDLKNGNAILLGAIHTDPWVGLLQSSLNFKFVCGRRVNDCYISNAHPAQGESAAYRTDPNGPSRETYAIVALLPNLDRSGWILLIEGLNMAGTEAAANMLLDSAAMRPMIRQTMSRNGTLRPFELLVRTGSFDAEALPSRIIAWRFGE